jgi:two-component system, response regulator
MRPRYILVVEDSNEDFETVQDAAQRVGMRRPIVRATSGGECLRLLRSAIGRPHALPLLLLLDLNTPGIDGRDVLRDIRQEEGLSTLPIVVLSASANPRDLHFCYSNHANAYHVKPVDHALHLQMLQLVFSYWLDGAVLPS